MQSIEIKLKNIEQSEKKINMNQKIDQSQNSNQEYVEQQKSQQNESNESSIKIYQFKDLINQRMDSFKKDKQNLSQIIEQRSAKSIQSNQTLKPQKNIQQIEQLYTHKKNQNEIDFIQKMHQEQLKQQQLITLMNNQLQLKLMENQDNLYSKRIQNQSFQMQNMEQESKSIIYHQQISEDFKTSRHVQNLNQDIHYLATIFNNKILLQKSFKQLKLYKDLRLMSIYKTTYEQKLKLKIFGLIKIHNYEKKISSQMNKYYNSINENLKLISFYNKNHQSNHMQQTPIQKDQPLTYSELK